jgi:hypothetical protein
VTSDAQISHWILPLFNREMANKSSCQSIHNTADVVCCKRPPKSPPWVEGKYHKFSRIFIATILGYVVCLSVITEGRDYDMGIQLLVDSYRLNCGLSFWRSEVAWCKAGGPYSYWCGGFLLLIEAFPFFKTFINRRIWLRWIWSLVPTFCLHLPAYFVFIWNLFLFLLSSFLPVNLSSIVSFHLSLPVFLFACVHFVSLNYPTMCVG